MYRSPSSYGWCLWYFIIIIQHITRIMGEKLMNKMSIIKAKKISLITGVSSGIGEHLARLLIQKGWIVIGIARRKEILERLEKELGSDVFIPYRCDVTQPQQVAAVTLSLKEKDQIPCLFFLNAGEGWGADHESMNVEAQQKVFDVNYFGVIRWIEEWFPLVKNREATFVAMSSLITLCPAPFSISYCVSKTALSTYFKSLRLRYNRGPVRFVTVLPGGIKTALYKKDKIPPLSWAPDKAAHYILKKVFSCKEVIAFPFLWVCSFRILNLMPKNLAAKIWRQAY